MAPAVLPHEPPRRDKLSLFAAFLLKQTASLPLYEFADSEQVHSHALPEVSYKPN